MEKKAFRLGGEQYRLSRGDVEKKMRDVQPKPVGKYQVLVSGVFYPPKQVIAETLGKELVSFTTMDATRVLSALGFDVLGRGTSRSPVKNESEVLLEQYLVASGLSEFQFQREFPSKARRPDYALSVQSGHEILLEVKEFRSTLSDFRSGAYDPYVHIREKIQQAREQFKEFKEHCCCLVLFNRDKPLVDLNWQTIYGAMLGNLGFGIPMNPETGMAQEESTQQVFMGGGTMVRYQGEQPLEPQNRTISAIIVLDLLPVGDRRFKSYILHLERELRREVDWEEHLQLANECRGTDRDVTLTQLRAVVHENPDARIQLPQELFSGPWDERYGRDQDRRIRRLYVGPEISKLEGKTVRIGDAIAFAGKKGRHLDDARAECPGRDFEVKQVGANDHIQRVQCTTCHREVSASDNRVWDFSIVPPSKIEN